MTTCERDNTRTYQQHVIVPLKCLVKFSNGFRSSGWNTYREDVVSQVLVLPRPLQEEATPVKQTRKLRRRNTNVLSTDNAKHACSSRGPCSTETRALLQSGLTCWTPFAITSPLTRRSPLSHWPCLPHPAPLELTCWSRLTPGLLLSDSPGGAGWPCPAPLELTCWSQLVLPRSPRTHLVEPVGPAQLRSN